MTLLLQFVVSFGFILAVNSPQNMVAYGTETFDVRDFVRTGLVLTVIALALADAARRHLLALARLRLTGQGSSGAQRSRLCAPRATVPAGRLPCRGEPAQLLSAANRAHLTCVKKNTAALADIYCCGPFEFHASQTTG